MAKPVLVTSAIITKHINGTENVLLVLNQKNHQKCYGFPGGVGGFIKTFDPAQDSFSPTILGMTRFRL
jgi:ADP-ribose pyrophosphatase YjhB (NUDIX family)